MVKVNVSGRPTTAGSGDVVTPSARSGAAAGADPHIAKLLLVMCLPALSVWPPDCSSEVHVVAVVAPSATGALPSVVGYEPRMWEPCCGCRPSAPETDSRTS